MSDFKQDKTKLSNYGAEEASFTNEKDDQIITKSSNKQNTMELSLNLSE